MSLARAPPQATPTVDFRNFISRNSKIEIMETDHNEATAWGEGGLRKKPGFLEPC